MISFLLQHHKTVNLEMHYETKELRLIFLSKLSGHLGTEQLTEPMLKFPFLL